ncbi:MAG: WD40 repeat protein [Saprospiraceae bacterium]
MAIQFCFISPKIKLSASSRLFLSIHKKKQNLSNIHVSKIAQLTGHKAGVFALSDDNEAKYFLSGAGEGWIVRWDLENPDLGKVIAKAENNIYSLCHLPDSGLVIAGNMIGGVHWIDLTDSDQSKNIQHHQKGVYDIQRIGDHIVTLGGGGMLTKWSIEERRTLESLHLTNQSLRAVDYNKTRNELAIGASDNNIYILDAENWRIKHVIKNAHENSVFTVKYAPNGNYLWSGGRDAHLKIWDLERDFELAADQSAHWFTINDIAFHPDGHLLATASRDKTIKIWDAASFKLLKVIETIRDGGHINSVNALYWSSYNNYLISCSDDRSLIVWEVKQEIKKSFAK